MSKHLKYENTFKLSSCTLLEYSLTPCLGLITVTSEDKNIIKIDISEKLSITNVFETVKHSCGVKKELTTTDSYLTKG